MNNLALFVTLMSMDDNNLRIAMIADYFADVPYSYSHTVNNDLNQLDCQTFVQTALALLHAKNKAQFEKNIVRVSYGALNFPGENQIDFYNRNHFIDADFNRVNERQHILKDITAKTSRAIKYAFAYITRARWFAINKPLTHLKAPTVKNKKVRITYIPKDLLVVKENNLYQVNQQLLDQIKVPAILEVVVDPNKWWLNGDLVKNKIGSETSVSHLGLLYRKQFKFHDIMYHRINCHLARRGRACLVMEVYCNKPVCNTLMFAHATTAYPNHYFWQNMHGHYQCTPTVDTKKPYTLCNRLERVSFSAYLLDQQYGTYRFIDNPAILGIHIEAIL